MVVRASREVVIDASPAKVLDTLADVTAMEMWSPVHQRVQVVDVYPDGRPHHVQVTIKLPGLVDDEIIEYHWGRDWVIWDATATSKQHDQHVEFTVKPVEPDRTRLRFDITVEPSGPIPAILVRRAMKLVLHAATDRLRDQVTGGGAGQKA